MDRQTDRAALGQQSLPFAKRTPLKKGNFRPDKNMATTAQSGSSTFHVPEEKMLGLAWFWVCF